MLNFCPQDLGAKEKGRAEQLKASGLSYKEAASFFVDATPKNFQRHYNNFVKAFPKQAKIISDLRSNGVGPGEMIAWFLYDNITVGGANACCDLRSPEGDFAEVKGGRYCIANNSLDDFKLSRDDDPSVKFIVNALSKDKDIITIDRRGNIKDEYGNTIATCNQPGFQRKITEILAEKQRIDVDNTYTDLIIEEWKNKIFQEYLNGKTFALIDTQKLNMRYFGPLTKDMVGLYRITRNQPKARVFLPNS